MKNSHIKLVQLVLGTVLLAGSGVAAAQLGGLGKAMGGGGSSLSADQIVSKYVGGTQSVLRADASMLDAVGLKDESEKASVQAKNLTEGATKDALEDASKTQTASSQALEQKLDGQKVQMDAASKKKFSAGVVDLAKGVMQYVGMSKDVASFKPGISSLGSSANSALFVAKNLPDSIKGLSHTLKMAMDFSKANNIPVPKEANEATSML